MAANNASSCMLGHLKCGWSRQVAFFVRVAEKTLFLTGDEANALQRSKVVWSEARLATQGTLADQAQEGELSMCTF